MADDERQLQRTGQVLIVEVNPYSGSPPAYESGWHTVWAAKVDRIEIGNGAQASIAVVSFPDLRWDADHGLRHADRIRITTAEADEEDRTCVFSGFITNQVSSFAGGPQKSKGHERNAVICADHRWLLQRTTVAYGQFVRGPDDYDNYGTDTQTAKADGYTYMTGRRLIFNADGKPNRDPVYAAYEVADGVSYDTPIFAARESQAAAWTVKEMLAYIINVHNTANEYFEITDPMVDPILVDDDMDRVITHVVCDGLDVLTAIDQIVRQVGWSFREDYTSGGTALFTFYKVNSAEGATRGMMQPTIRHELHAPAAGEFIGYAVGEGRKMLVAAQIAEDIGDVINSIRGLGAPDRFEFTAELVPAWKDADLVPDTSQSNAQVYMTEADLQSDENPNGYSVYDKYHVKGDSFWSYRDVGRKWTLNEAGNYSAGLYDRGMPFDFAGVIDAEYMLDDAGKRLYAPFNRQLLPCLTRDEQTLDSVGIKVEFSLDGGVTWQVMSGVINSLSGEAGIYIDEPNLGEMLNEGEDTISGGTLDGADLNFWTRLCDDKLQARSFKDGDWKTRVRVTASIQMDQRLVRFSEPSSAGGSPFEHKASQDHSDSHGIAKRMAASMFEAEGLPAEELDTSAWLTASLDRIREANEDMSISGQYLLDRMWLTAFACGDAIERITGRDYDLSVDYGSRTIYPEIIQIVHLPTQQKTSLITRDLRFAEVVQPES